VGPVFFDVVGRSVSLGSFTFVRIFSLRLLSFSHQMLPFEHRELLIQGRRSGMVVLSTIGLLCDGI